MSSTLQFGCCQPNDEFIIIYSSSPQTGGHAVMTTISLCGLISPTLRTGFVLVSLWFILLLLVVILIVKQYLIINNTIINSVIAEKVKSQRAYDLTFSAITYTKNTAGYSATYGNSTHRNK